MTIRVSINHRTRYKFDRPVSLSPHTVRLRPAPHSRTPIHSYSLKIKPDHNGINEYLGCLLYTSDAADE